MRVYPPHFTEQLEASDKMSKVTGLEERLHGLEAIVVTARKVLLQQNEITVVSATQLVHTFLYGHASVGVSAPR